MRGLKLIQGDFVDRFHQSHPSRVRGLKPVIVYDSSKSPVAAARLSEDLPPVDELYLEADEDYLKVGGLHAQARLVYFHEGVAEHPRRHLTNARYFTTVQKKPEEFWFEVWDYLEAHYDLDSLQELYLSGDGASWIRTVKKELKRLSRKRNLGRENLNNVPIYSSGSNLTRMALKGLNSITAV